MRTASTLAAAALLALPAALDHADGVPPKLFYADSTSPLDGCALGYTKGTLFWRTPVPLPPIAAVVNGGVGDRPETNDARDCANDG